MSFPEISASVAETLKRLNVSESDRKIIIAEIESLDATNIDLWNTESLARSSYDDVSRLGGLKKRIDVLNARRNGHIEKIDLLLASHLQPGKKPKVVSIDSPGDVLDRLSVSSQKLAKLESTPDTARAASLREDIELWQERLTEILQAAVRREKSIKSRSREKIYDATREPQRFADLSKEAAWNLHSDFRNDMRQLRDEEYRLTGVYISIASLGGVISAGFVFTTAGNPENKVWLAKAFFAMSTSVYLLLLRRIWKKHCNYQMLGRWVRAIRDAHASSANLGEIGKGSGYLEQILLITICWIVTSAIILVMALTLPRPG